MVEREGTPLCFCVERAMDVEHYVKYNNNSGFVPALEELPSPMHDSRRAPPAAWLGRTR